MKLPKEIREQFRKAGKKGGKTALDNMTPKQRSERAKKAAAGRWNKESK